jgi:hypothetical protein
MSMPHPARCLPVVLALVLLAGCGAMGVGPDRADGARRLVVKVRNDSGQPATLVVAEGTTPMGRVIGATTPGIVPPGTTLDVVLAVPSGRDWAIFVNPGPERGPLVTAADVPDDADGPMPFQIGIEADGAPYANLPDLPGWFGA